MERYYVMLCFPVTAYIWEKSRTELKGRDTYYSMNITFEQKICIQGHTADIMEEWCSTSFLIQRRTKCLMMVLGTSKLINNQDSAPLHRHFHGPLWSRQSLHWDTILRLLWPVSSWQLKLSRIAYLYRSLTRDTGPLKRKTSAVWQKW